MHLELMPWRFDVTPLVAELKAHSELWDEFPFRTTPSQSPHRDMSDIVVRCNARENFSDRESFGLPHESVWYPNTEKLPSVLPIVFDLMRYVDGERLGMVLITRLPAGKQCHPHIDQGWHPNFYDKYAVQIASAAGQSFHVDTEMLSAEPGECYRFNNAISHWVINDSDKERITMIVCIRNRFTGA
jgi:hypothetical protein